MISAKSKLNVLLQLLIEDFQSHSKVSLSTSYNFKSTLKNLYFSQLILGQAAATQSWIIATANLANRLLYALSLILSPGSKTLNI